MRRNWEKLDNAAKIYPSTQIKTDTHVFRLSCELLEDIDKDILQQALEETLDIFDLYRVVLKRGFFWYYLDSSNIVPRVSEEHASVCAKLYDNDEKSLLLEVTYYKKRINLEMFHVLSDGIGAVNFLRTLVCKYLSKKLAVEEPLLDFDASRTQMQEYSFDKYYSGSKSWKREKHKPAGQINGIKYSQNRMRVITGRMSTKSVLEKAREHKCTLTVYLSACLVLSLAEVLSVREKKKPVTLCIPVNLRRYFPSESIRNFFATLYVPYFFPSNGIDFDEIVKVIRSGLDESLTEERLTANLNSLAAAENNLFAKIVPLRIKDISLRRLYVNNLKNYTATVSNMGTIHMPEVFRDKVRSFDVTIGTSKMHVCICTYLDNLSISFSTPFQSSDIERTFFRIFSFAGIDVEITANNPDGQEDS